MLQDCKIIWIQPSASGDGRLQTALEKAQRRIREGSSLGVCLGARLPAPRTGGLGCERGTWTGAGGRVARRRSTRGAGRAASLRTRLFQRSPRLALSRGHIFVPEAGSPLPPTLAHSSFGRSRQAPSRAGRAGRSGEERSERSAARNSHRGGRPGGAGRAGSPRRWGLPREGPAGALSLPPGGAVRLASAALSFRAPARTRARGTSAPTGPRLTPAPPRPSWGGSAQLVSRVLPEASPGRWDFTAEAAALLWRGCSGARWVAGLRAFARVPALAPIPPLSTQEPRTMLCCLLVRASNLPSVKKDRRSDPVASLTFRGESPVATVPAPLSFRAHRQVCGPSSGTNPSPSHSSLPLSAGTEISVLSFAEGEEDGTEHNKCHSAPKFWKTECAIIRQQLPFF